MSWRTSITRSTAFLTLSTLAFAIIYGLFMADELGVALASTTDLVVRILSGVVLVALLVVSWAKLRLEIFLGPRE